VIKVKVPLVNVRDNGRYRATLSEDTRLWLYKNVGDNRNYPMNRVPPWEYVDADLNEGTAVFEFSSKKAATLFKMFYG
jgi:hypothetical protein